MLSAAAFVLAVAVGLALHCWGEADVAASITTGANVLVAGLTLLAAVAAMRSAASSELVTKRATEALARTLAPSLNVTAGSEQGGPLVGSIAIADGDGAAFVEATWSLTDGGRVRFREQRLSPPTYRQTMSPGAGDNYESHPESIQLLDTNPDPLFGAAAVSRVVVSYSDERRLGRWRQVWIPSDKNILGIAQLVPETPVLLS